WSPSPPRPGRGAGLPSPGASAIEPHREEGAASWQAFPRTEHGHLVPANVRQGMGGRGTTTRAASLQHLSDQVLQESALRVLTCVRLLLGWVRTGRFVGRVALVYKACLLRVLYDQVFAPQRVLEELPLGGRQTTDPHPLAEYQ